MTPAALALCAGLVAASASVALAQAPRVPVIEVSTQVVSANVVVFDSAGRFVKGLTPADVELLEDGVPQEVTFFKEASDKTGEKIPLSVVLALDSSGSMAKNLHFLQEAANTFVNKLEDIDAALVVQFNSSVKSSAEFTSDLDHLSESIEGMQAWGGTSLFDAVHYALGRVRQRPGRKAVIVFSDGADHDSTLGEDDVVAYGQAVEATVYSVAIKGNEGGGTSKGFLQKIAKETGGSFFFPDRVGDLIKIFADIASELHNHYAMGYTPKRAPDGTWRSIQVRLKNRKDLQVRVRKGYVAVKPKRPAQ